MAEIENCISIFEAGWYFTLCLQEMCNAWTEESENENETFRLLNHGWLPKWFFKNFNTSELTMDWKALVLEDKDTNESQLSKIGCHCFNTSQHLLTASSSNFILLLCNSFGFVNAFFISVSSSISERNLATMWLVSTHLWTVLSEVENPINPPKKKKELIAKI